jgi:RHS repeat-associated protein
MNHRHLSRCLALAALVVAATASYSGAAQSAVGRTEAAYGVTQNGAATYTIPIRATEGINGMTPHLAINYAGPGSRSILGVGFALSGISYITPCRKTIAQDLNAAPVTLTSADRYCLDGARLRLIDSGDTYGGSNVQYRTELDQMVRVTSKASTSNVPGWFRVEMPNGLEYEYGNSTTSKLMSSALPGATPQFWAVSKISDPFGNEIIFTYDTDNAAQRFRPSSISYTERGSAGHYKISFVYRVTPQLPVLYFTPSAIGGAAHKEDKVVDRIELKHDDVVYRAYKFIYQDGAGDNERLQEVQECAYNPAEDCLLPTEFAWQSATEGHNPLASTSKAVASGVIALDINGDGIEDLAWASGGTWRYMLGGASGFGNIVTTTFAATNPSKAMPLEWNGDGFGDLLIDWSSGTWRVLRGGANGFIATVVQPGSSAISSSTASTAFTVADVDGDGRDDLISVPLNATLAVNVRFNSASGMGASTQVFVDYFVHTKASNPFIALDKASAIRRPDFNGDGRTDLIIYGCIWETDPPGWCITDRWFQLTSQGTTFVNEGPMFSAAFNIQVRFGDFNGDGLTDVIYPATTGNWSLGFGQGSGGFSYSGGPSSAAHATYQTMTGDYDGDGFDDFYVTKNSPWEWEIFRSTGTALATTPITTTISGDGLGWKLLDQNGDSLPDLGRYNVSGLVWRIGTHQGLPGERLLTATDGLENAVGFSYLPMTDATVYAKGTGAIFPERDFKGSSPLVRSLQMSPAGGASYTLDFKYLNARIHGQGRSFLGMGERQITDNRNGVYTIETYKQDFPYIGAPATVTTKQSTAGSAKTIQSATHTYLKHVLSPTAGNERYLPYRSTTVTNAHEVGGVRNGDPITQVTETHSVNTWGNSTFVSISAKDTDTLSLETGLIYTTEVTSTFMENSTDWCIGPSLTRSVKKILPGGTNATRDASWQVTSADCRVTQETIEPGAGSAISLVTDLDYDTCGNVNLVVSEPAGTTGQERTTNIDYGSRCQRPETITNPEGHVSSLAYGWPLALPSTQTDPNGLEVDFEYDGFGRLTHELRPNGTGVRFALTACTSGNSWCGKNNSARVKVTRTERNTSDAVLRTDEQFFDGLGRARWSHSDSLESGPSIVETFYDALNRVTARTQPYFAGGQVYVTTYQPDLIGRIKEIDAPISETAVSGRITGLAYEGRNLEVTDPENFTTTRRSNVLGHLRAIVDPSPGGTSGYAYHPFGELASITDANLNVTSWGYNDRGFVTSTSDADSGNWTYEVNAFGETTKARDAKTTSPNWTTQFAFDKLSRPVQRIEAEGNTDFVWGKLSDNSASNKYIGRLKSVTSPGNYSETYTFDQYSRLTRLRTAIEGTNYDFDQNYWASTSLPKVLTYPASTGSTRFQAINNYQNNLLSSVADNVGSTVFWIGTSTDAWGHYQDENFGDGVATFTDFDQAIGLMATREGGVGGGTGQISSVVDWEDLRGNFTERQDLKLVPTVTEAFVNDSISRLDVSTRNGTQNLDVNVDVIGNITSKGGQTYLYTGSHGCIYHAHVQPRAVRKIGSTVYCYDKNGNMIQRGGSNISYTSYNLPTAINSGSNSSTLTYGAFRNRFKQVAVASGSTETTLYVAGLFERVTRPGGVIEYRHYVPGGQGTAAIHTRRSSGTNNTYYWHADHLGSPELFTDQAGATLVRPSFGAFGERRDGSDWIGPPSAADLTTIGNITPRGFTGHEHLDAVGVIHMNGRVYDPVAGRFLSRDPMIDGVFNSQGLNGYAYVHNNPLRFVDPSGLCIFDPVTGSLIYCDTLDETSVYGARINWNAGQDFIDWLRSQGYFDQSGGGGGGQGSGNLAAPEVTPTGDPKLEQARQHACFAKADRTAHKVATFAAFTAAGALSGRGLPGALAGVAAGAVAIEFNDYFSPNDVLAQSSGSGIGNVMLEGGNPSAFIGSLATGAIQDNFNEYPGVGMVGGSVLGAAIAHYVRYRAITGMGRAMVFGGGFGVVYMGTYGYVLNQSLSSCGLT